MSTTYELWDFTTRNLVGVFNSEEEALTSVRETLREHGRSAVVTLLLGRVEEDGDGGEIAAGDDLIARVGAAAGNRPRAVATGGDLSDPVTDSSPITHAEEN